MSNKKRTLLASLVISLTATGATQAQTLEEAIRATLASHPEISEQRNTRLATERDVRQARAGYLPSIDLNAGIGRENSDNASTRSRGDDSVDLTRQELGIALRQPLFEGFATRHEVARHTERVNARAYTLHATAESIAQRVAEVYLEVLRRQELVRLARENLQAHEKTHEQVTTRGAYGVGRGADVDQARSRLLLASANLAAEEGNLREAEINYFRVVDLAPQGLEKPAAVTVTEALPDAVRQAIANHPTLKAAAADIEAAKQQRETARGPYYPRLDLELGANRNQDLDGVEGDDEDLYAMLRMRYNLYAGGKDKARRAQTLYNIGEARDIRTNTCREVVEGMRLSWNAHKTLEAQEVYLRQRVEASVSARDNYQRQFTLGQRSLLDLLDSENEVYQGRKALLNAEYDRQFAGYRVLTGKGKLLETLGLAAPEEAKPATVNLSEINCAPEFPAQEVAAAAPLAPAPRVVEVVVPAPAPMPIIKETVREVPAAPVVYERLTLQAGALFDTDKAELKSEGIAELNDLAEKVKSKARVQGLEIVGHTDDRGSDEHNLNLSRRRAQAVADHLAQRGIPAALMTVSGKGEDLPVASNKTAEGRAKNRRVEVNIRMTRKMEGEAVEGQTTP